MTTIPNEGLIRPTRVALAALAAVLAGLDGILVALPASVVTISTQLLVALGLFSLTGLSLSVAIGGLETSRAGAGSGAGAGAGAGASAGAWNGPNWPARPAHAAPAAVDLFSVREMHGWYAVFDHNGQQVAYCPTEAVARGLAARLGRAPATEPDASSSPAADGGPVAFAPPSAW